MEEPCPRDGGDGYGGGPLLLRRERCRGARLVVVLDETDQPVLVGRVGAEVEPDALRRIVFQAVIEPSCRNRSRTPAAGAPTPGPSRPRP